MKTPSSGPTLLDVPFPGPRRPGSTAPAWWSAALAAVLLYATTVTLRTQSYTQTITLNPGWNAVSLQVTPTDTAVGDVFSNPAIAAVWQPIVRVSTVAFIQNPGSPAFNTAGWSVYVPASQPASVNNNLFNVSANRPYLVQISGGSPITVVVTGRPSLRALPLGPNAFTLRGFYIDPATEPTFGNYFAHSRAQNPAGQGQAIYWLNNATGQWQLAAANNLMTNGVPYWVYSVGASSYMGPLSVTPKVGDGLDFGNQAVEEDLAMTNFTTAAMTETITDTGAGSRPLTYSTAITNAASPQWLPLPQTYTVILPAGGIGLVRFGIQRSQMTSSNYATVLTISDGQGSLFPVAVTAQLPGVGPIPTPGIITAKGIPKASPSPQALQAGLWSGDISVSAVAQTYANPTQPTPTVEPFQMRLLLHVTTNGTTRLLREAIEMFQNPVLTTNSSGVVSVAQPGQAVLLTDPTLVPQFTGVALSDNRPVGLRFSTASFDYDLPGGTTNFLTMSGTFGTNNTVSVSITLHPATPTNPFLHQYHPDHGVNQAFTVTRQIALTFTATDPAPGQVDSDYGTTTIGGTYSETLTGLHKNPLVVSGIFHLQQIANIPLLNLAQ